MNSHQAEKKQSIYTIDDFKLSIVRKKQQDYYLQLNNIKSQLKLSRTINNLNQLPKILEKVFDSISEFIQSLQTIICQRIVSKDKKSIYVDHQSGKLCFNVNMKIGKKNKPFKVELQFFKQSIRVEYLQKKILQLQKKVQQFIGNQLNQYKDKNKDKQNKDKSINYNDKDKSISYKDKDKSNNYKENIAKALLSGNKHKDGQIIHYQNPILLQAQKQLKNKIKQSKVQQKQKQSVNNSNNRLNFQSGTFSNIKYELYQNKIVLIDPHYRINAEIIINKNKRNAIIVQIQSLTNQMKYLGQLNDLEIVQFLEPSTKLKNSKEIMNQIKKNLKNNIKQSLRLNDRQNKCQILIIGKDGNNDRITAQIQVKPIVKQQKIINQAISTTQKSKERQRQIQKKEKIKEKDNQKDKSKENQIKQKQKNNTKKAFDSLSQISFRTKHTTKPSKKSEKLNSTVNGIANLPDFDISAQISLNNYTQDLSNISDVSKIPKTSKGFLLNEQIKNFKISKNIIELKSEGLNCIILGRKVSKKTKQLQSQIKIMNNTNFLIFGIGTEEVGLQNTLLSKFFIGMSAQTGAIYQNGVLKDNKLFKKLKEIKQGALIKIRINLKNQVISWYTKQDEKQDAFVLAKEIFIPQFMKVRQIYPTVFIRNKQDKVQFTILK